MSATLVPLLIAAGLGCTGCGICGIQEKESAVQQLYGVADLETLVKSHPKYSEYFKRESEYNHLLVQYKNEQKKLIEISSRQADIRAAVKDQSLRLAAENELKLRIRRKEEEINKKLHGLYTEIENKHHRKGGSHNLESLTPEERAHIANLQMKLAVLGVSGEEKEKVKEELQAFLDTRIFPSFSARSDWSQDEIRIMTAAKETGKSELDAYAQSEAEKMRTRLETDRQEAVRQIEQNLFHTGAAPFNEQWQVQLKTKQKEMAALKESIMEDIRREAGRVASEKNLKMIFSKYRANINAVDVTAEVAGRMINRS